MQKINISSFVVFRYWLNQNNSKKQLIILASLTFLDFEVIFMRLHWDDDLSTYLVRFFFFDIFIGAVKQIVKFISYLTTVRVL